MLSTTFLFALSLVPCLVSAGMYPKDGPVKMLTAANFKKVMSEEKASIVAFVAPWCGHCKNLTPEYIKAAKSLDPLVPFYAVDCDAEENKQLCSEQGVKGFPTIKSFPRGTKTVPHDYQGERKAGPIVEYMYSEVPNRVAVIKGKEQIEPWLQKESIPHALLLTSKPKTPLQWKVLQNKFNKKIAFAASKDADGSVAQSFGIESATGKGSVVLVWPADATEPLLYDGPLKYESLQNYLQLVKEGKHASHQKEEL